MSLTKLAEGLGLGEQEGALPVAFHGILLQLPALGTESIISAIVLHPPAIDADHQIDDLLLFGKAGNLVLSEVIHGVQVTFPYQRPVIFDRRDWFFRAPPESHSR